MLDEHTRKEVMIRIRMDGVFYENIKIFFVIRNY